MAVRLLRERSGPASQDAPANVIAIAPSSAQARNFYQRHGKRGLDLFLILILSPFWILVYLAIIAFVLIVDGRPIHYRSARIGRDGQDIEILKFRTMRVDADSSLAALLAADPALEEEYEAAVKLRNDPRVTRSGRWLRRTSLDELPQLVNVLTGDMSLIGPRPVLTQAELDDFFGDYSDEVVRLRPGMSGLWQVSGRSLLSYEERVALDLEYSRVCSFQNDLLLLARTIPSVIQARGAF